MRQSDYSVGVLSLKKKVTMNGNNTERGLDCEFLEQPPEQVQSECPVCLLVLREPYQVNCCGYAFCKKCIERVRLESRICPCCNAEAFNMFEDKRLKRSLYAFRVHCTHKKQGCQWEGELGQLDNHLNYNPPEEKQLEGCQFSIISCLFCSNHSLRSTITTHQHEECPKRPFSCEHCKDYNSTFEDIITNHWQMCSYYPITCTNGCGDTVQRQNFENHIINECPLTVVDCDFQHVGCEVRLPRKDMPVHLVESAVCHLSLQTSVYKQVMIQMNEEIKQLRQQVMNLTREVETQRNSTPINVCPLELKMTKFKRRRENNEVWYSLPFYSYWQGYKMRLRIYFNRRADSKGKYLSVYVQLMKGEFDDQLEWPFQGKLEIQLLNQNKDEEHDTGILNFKDNIATNAQQRVLDGNDSKYTHGFSKFALICTLRPNFLKNNCLRFRVKYHDD